MPILRSAPTGITIGSRLYFQYCRRDDDVNIDDLKLKSHQYYENVSQFRNIDTILVLEMA